MKKVDFKSAKYFVADFETTVYTGQKETEVWAAALTSAISSYDDEVSVFNNIEDFLEACVKLTVNESAIVYFHNLKFDGSFILSCLLRQGFVYGFSFFRAVSAFVNCTSTIIFSVRCTGILCRICAICHF